jgi:hypothetical protein
MASSYDISLGSDTIELLKSDNSYATIQIVSTVDLDSGVSVSLKHSSDGENYETITDTTTAISSGVNTVLIETLDYTLDTLYLDIDVLSATVGTLNIYISSKKKDSESVSATITGDVNVASTSESLANQDILIRNTRALEEIKELIKITNIHLSLITGSDIN